MLKSTIMFAFASLLANDTLRLSSENSSIEAIARGPAGITLTAMTRSLQDTSSDSEWRFSANIDDFKTGLSLRDEHMKDAFEASKFPVVSVRIPASETQRPPADEEASGHSRGYLSLHGVERPIDVSYYVVSDCEGNVGVKASFEFDITDFDLKPPGYLGINVKPRVEVTANLRLESSGPFDP